MQGRLTPLGQIIKWVLIPLAIAAVGYFFIGPSIGKGIFDRLPKNILGPSTETEKPKGPSVDLKVNPR